MNKYIIYSEHVEILINSPKYGKHIVYLDKKDLKLVKSYNWHLQKGGRTFYPLTNIHKNNKRTVIRIHMLLYPNKLIDHIDGNGLDNRRKNLRIATKQENNRNTNKRLDGITSKYKGVCKHNTGFVAQISINGERNYIGWFKNEKEAARAYNKEAKKYFGEFCRLNIIED